jgi:hypothetical protein
VRGGPPAPTAAYILFYGYIWAYMYRYRRMLHTRCLWLYLYPYGTIIAAVLHWHFVSPSQKKMHMSHNSKINTVEAVTCLSAFCSPSSKRPSPLAY